LNCYGSGDREGGRNLSLGDNLFCMGAATLAAAGFTGLRTEVGERSRPLNVDLWYPAAPKAAETVFQYQPGSQGTVAVQASPADEAAPLIVFSPGVLASARNYTWLAEHFARHGFIVAGVSHYGESAVYGPESVDPRAASKSCERPRDCAAALDFILAHPLFGKAADPARIGAIGHANGGAAVIALAGAVYDSAAMEEYCSSGASRGDRFCRHAVPGSTEERDLANRSWKDERIRAVAALDPSAGPGHNARSLSQVQIPVHIVASVDNDFLPFEHHAGRYARLIPGASLTPLAHGEGHFVFMDVCSGNEEVDGVPVCRDRDGVRRSSVHARVLDILVRFFAENLA